MGERSASLRAIPDVKNFRSKLKKVPDEDERVVADNRYRDEKCLLGGDVHEHDLETHKRIHARHEVINRRLKQFSGLRLHFVTT